MFETIEEAKLVDVIGGVNWGAAAMNASTMTNLPQKVAPAMASGKFDFNRMVDNGNRYGAAGGILGAGGGGMVAGPGGATAGGTAGGLIGWLGGAAYDANQQANEINARR